MDIYINTHRGESFKAKLVNPEHCHIPISTELVFQTSYYGHQQILTDPSYKGQALLYSFPITGAIGSNLGDSESRKPYLDAIIIHQTPVVSHTHHEQSDHFLDFCNKHSVPVIEIMDQRELTLKLRDNSETFAVITSQKDAFPSDSSIPTILSKQKYTRSTETPLNISISQSREHVAIIDFGVKNNIVNSCLKRQADVTLFSENVTLEELKSYEVDRVLFSNGPGNPKDYLSNQEELLSIIKYYPTLGICLGHQIICLLMGLQTRKMKFGHRGVNHPIQNKRTNKIYHCSQNHGHEVVFEENKDLEVLFENLIDQSVEGITHKELPIITTQFHPESNPGPRETSHVFDDFFNLKKKGYTHDNQQSTHHWSRPNHHRTGSRI